MLPTYKHRVNIPIPKGRNRRVARKDQTKERPKPSRTNIKWCDVSSTGLGHPCPS
jgi:hypothetical protein